MADDEFAMTSSESDTGADDAHESWLAEQARLVLLEDGS
jgi:hypothetical protein